MAIPTLSGSYIDETYGRLIQTSGSEFADGFGNPISFGPVALSGGIDGYIPIWSGSIALSNSIVSQTTNRLNVSGSLNVTGGITGSLAGTASWAYNVVNQSNIDTSSFATTGSNTFIGNQTITGSLIVQGYVSGSFTGSFNDGIPKLILTGVTDTLGTLTYNTVINTLGDTFAFTATNGVYELTMSTTTPFTSGYTYIMFSAGLPGPGGGNVYNTPYEYIDDSTIKFYVKKNDAPYDGVLTQGTIEIRVYPLP